MATGKPIKANLKMRIPAGRATPAPPVGSTLGQHGVNSQDFINPFNEMTKDMKGIVTAHVTIFMDKTMKFRVVTQPTDELIRAALGVAKGSGKPNSEKLEQKLTDAQLTEIATVKAMDMNTEDIPAVKKIVAGTARSMGVLIEG
jgi:large subunit ribosomal protein L11